MITAYKSLVFIVGIFMVSFSAFSQSNYLLNFEHKEPRASESLYFYLEEQGAGKIHNPADPSILVLDDAVYKIYFLRFSEPAPSSYLGCVLHADQARGEELSINQLLADSVLTTYAEKQRAIEAECGGLFDKKGRQNSVFTMALNDQDAVKMLKVDLDVCACKVSRAKFSPVSDTLAMARKIIKAGVFSDPEKAYWENRMDVLLGNALVKSCLPMQDRYFKSYQAGRD